MPNTSLFAKDAVYISDSVDRDMVFSDVYRNLLKAGYVKGDRTNNIELNRNKTHNCRSTRKGVLNYAKYKSVC